MKPLKYICVMSCRCCFPQDMVHTCVIQHVGLHTLRNSKTKEFFNLDCGGPDCAQALEQNFTFVLELCATLSGADPWPRHKQFKAGLVHSVWQSVKSYIYIYLSIWFVLPIGNLVRRCRSLRYLLRRDNEADNQGVLFISLVLHWSGT